VMVGEFSGTMSTMRSCRSDGWRILGYNEYDE
jgi:hypothetical protein